METGRKPEHGKEKIEEYLTTMLKEKLGIEEAKIIKPTDNIRDEFGADSLDMVEITMEVEKQYELEVPDDAGMQVNTFEELVRITQECIDKKYYPAAK